MSVPTRRLAVAGVIAAAVIALPAAAFASGSAAPSGKPAPSAAVTKPGAPVKSPAAGKPASPAASAAAMKAAARQSGAGDQQAMQAMVAALAAQLGVSHSAAQRALAQIESLNRAGVDPASPAFAVIARELGVTPARLAAALGQAKQAAVHSVTGS
jgi:hypothetical protein